MHRYLLCAALLFLSSCSSHQDANANNSTDPLLTAANVYLAKHPDCIGIAIPISVGTIYDFNYGPFLKLGFVRIGDPPAGDLILGHAHERTYIATERGLKMFGITSNPARVERYTACFAVAHADQVIGKEAMSADFYGPNEHRIEFKTHLVFDDWVTDSNRQYVLQAVRNEKLGREDPFGVSTAGEVNLGSFMTALQMHQDPAEGWIAENYFQPTQS